MGLASIMSLLFGSTLCVYGVAVICDRSFITWLGWLAIIGGIPTAIGGIVIAYTGFSGLAMSINMPVGRKNAVRRSYWRSSSTEYSINKSNLEAFPMIRLSLLFNRHT